MDVYSRVVASQEQVSTNLENEVVIFNLKSGMYFGLNAVGARVWDLVSQPTQAGSVCETILAEYDVDADRCEKDVLTILESLEQAGLVEVLHEMVE